MKTTVAWLPMLLCALALRGSAQTPAPMDAVPPPAQTSVPPAAEDVKVVVEDAGDERGDFSGSEMAEWHAPASGPAPVLHYVFGKSRKSVRIKDRSGHGNDGTAVRPLRRVPGLAKGKWAARFDGASDYIRVPRSPSLEPEELTVDAWVRIDGNKPDFKDGAIVFKRNTASSCNEDYCLEILSDRTVLMTVSSPSSSSGQQRLNTFTSLAPDLWHHLAMTFRPGEAVVYVDGKESVRMQSSAGTNEKGPARLDHNPSADLFIGTRDHATYPLGRFGAFDLAELRIWPNALDAKRIAALYGKHADQPGVAKPMQNKACLDVEALCPAATAVESLVLHLAPSPSCKKTATVRDRSGRNNHGTASRPLHRVRDGDWRAWRFDSTQQDFIRIPRSPSLEPKAITVAAWVRVPGGIEAEDAEAVIFKRNTSFNDNEDYNLEILPDRRVRMTIGHSGGQKDVISRNALSPDQWHHLAMTFLDGEMRLYVDGEPAGEGRFIQALDHNPATDLLIGGRDYASHPMDRFAWFDLADLRIWSKALDGKQIASLYGEFSDRPNVAHPADNRTPTPPPRTTDRPGICGTPFLPSTNAVRGIRKDALVLHYAFRTPKDGMELRDCSGHQADGTSPKPLEWVRGPGNLGGALRFDGKEDCIRVPRSPSMEADVVTVAAWVKLDGSRPMNHTGTIVFKRNTSFHQNEDYHLEIRSDRVLQGFCGDGTGGQQKVVSPAPLAPDVWHHLAMTAGDGRVRLFVDGEPVADQPWPHTLAHNREADLFIGAVDHARYPIGNHCQMDLADLRIWSTVLSDAEIAALYREKYLFGDVARPGKERPSGPPRMFPQWQPPEDTGKGRKPADDLAAELRLLLAQGRRDKAASPEFLDALQNLLDRHAADAAPPPPSDRLPFRPDFLAPDMPPGWSAIKPDVWRFGDGCARQIRSWANDRFVLSYDPGRKWTDYTVTFSVESDAWFTPPARSSCVLYFRYLAPGDSFSLWLEGAGDLTLASHEREGHQRILARIPVEPSVIRDGKPWTVTVRGEEIEVWHEGARLMYATDPAHPAGTIGLESVHIPARFSGLSVTAGAVPPPKKAAPLCR